MPEASPRLLRANELLLDCVARGISPSTLVVEAFDAIYLCCIESTSECLGREEDVRHPDPEVLLSAKERLGTSSKEVTLALQLPKRCRDKHPDGLSRQDSLCYL